MTPGAPKRIDLVFRSVGERTADLALELAKQHIRPNKVHIIENVRPFRAAVDRMLQIDHDCDAVVHMDADCLILEDMRPFLDWNTHPYVDCYVRDRFRGHIHCGVHITRTDVVRAMRDVTPPPGDVAYVLRPESRLRNLALRPFAQPKRFQGFRILHDHHQSYVSLFEKYALRELRSRTQKQRGRLDSAMASWGAGADYQVVRAAIRYTREAVPLHAGAQEIDRFLTVLPDIARREVDALGLGQQPQLTRAEIPELDQEEQKTPKPHVFGLGLSRTGTRSLTMALHVLGFHTVHYPTDNQTLLELEQGDGRFSLLDHFDGLTDITVSKMYAQLDRLYPGSKFILTTRDNESWLQSAENHWRGRPAYDDPTKSETHLKIRRFLRASTYGTYAFDRARFSEVHEAHVRAVKAYFKGRPQDLLVYPLTAGAGWQPLTEFLGVAVPHEPFPHKGGGLTAKSPSLETGD